MMLNASVGLSERGEGGGGDAASNATGAGNIDLRDAAGGLIDLGGPGTEGYGRVGRGRRARARRRGVKRSGPMMLNPNQESVDVYGNPIIANANDNEVPANNDIIYVPCPSLTMGGDITTVLIPKFRFNPTFPDKLCKR